MTAEGPRPVGGEEGAWTEAITDGPRRGGGMPFGEVGPRVLRLLWLTLVWVLLWGTFSWANLLGGLLVAVLVLTLLPLPGVGGGGRRRPLPMLRVVGRVAADLAISSVQVAWQSVRPGPPLRSSVVAVRFPERSELLMAALVETLSLVPGSVVIEADAARGTLWAHVLGADTDDDVERFRGRVLALKGELVATGIAATRDPASPDGEEGR